jgi:hypothetical protein
MSKKAPTELPNVRRIRVCVRVRCYSNSFTLHKELIHVWTYCMYTQDLDERWGVAPKCDDWTNGRVFDTMT